MRRPLHILPTPSIKLLAVCVAGLVPAALAWVWPLGFAVACAIDATMVLLYVVDVILGRREHLLGADSTLPARIRRGVSFPITYELTNVTNRAMSVAWRHDMPDTITPALHSGTFDVEPGATHAWQVAVVAQRRGEVSLDPPVVVYSSPLGLSQIRVMSAGATVSVLPATQSLQHFDNLLRWRRQHEMGLVAARQRGEGSEIVGLRPYRVGDPLTHIDWKATARLDGALVSRELQAERRQSVVLLLDCGRRMAGEVAGRSRFDFTVESALLLAHVAHRSDDCVGMLAFADSVLRVVQPTSKASGGPMLASALFDLECVLREPPIFSGAPSWCCLRTPRSRRPSAPWSGPYAF